tara:strand:- start:5158 stop:5817 length:660 start_codon:yes stop_codon:yes gene_type:complete
MMNFEMEAAGVSRSSNIFKDIIKENLDHFMKYEMSHILYDYYTELGEKEEVRIHNDLMRKSKGSGDIYQRVAENMISLVMHTGSQKYLESVILEIGASDAGAADIGAGVTGSRGEDIAGILQYGKREGKELSKDILAKPTVGAIRRRLFGEYAKRARPGQGRGGGNFLLPEGWKSPEFEGIDFLGKSEERLRKVHEGPQLRNIIKQRLAQYKFPKGGRK